MPQHQLPAIGRGRQRLSWCEGVPHGIWNEVVRRHHPRGYDYYWMVGHYENDEPEAEDTDNWALNHGYVAITPTHMDVTAYEAIPQIKKWETA